MAQISTVKADKGSSRKTAIKKSIIVFIVMFALGLLSMGGLGFALSFIVAPVLEIWFPPADEWHGDWVWPATILAGMAWSFFFLAAGFINKKLEARKIHNFLRRALYALILWLGALCVWLISLYRSA